MNVGIIVEILMDVKHELSARNKSRIIAISLTNVEGEVLRKKYQLQIVETQRVAFFH